MANPTETGYRHPYPNYQLGDSTQVMDHNNAGQSILQEITVNNFRSKK